MYTENLRQIVINRYGHYWPYFWNLNYRKKLHNKCLDKYRKTGDIKYPLVAANKGIEKTNISKLIRDFKKANSNPINLDLNLRNHEKLKYLIRFMLTSISRNLP